MRKIYNSIALLCLLAVTVSWASAQTYQVTFQVDMSNEASIADTITVAGNFQAAAGYASDWTPGITILTDGNNDSIYDLTVNLPAGSYEYKFINGVAWGADEGVPGACAVNGNRGMNISANTTLPLVCFASCNPCVTSVDTVDVTISVDMRYQTIADTISIAGDFQSQVTGSNWTPGATILTDANNDSIYTATFRLAEGTYSYKFINGVAWGQDESVPSACAVNNNREMTIVGPGPQTIPTVCFATCDSACSAPLPPINVTFRVDMNNEIVNSGGVFVSGSFMSPAWVKDSLLMTDPNMDGIYSFTTSIVPAEYQFKYYNGPNGDPDGETADFATLGCGVANGVGGWNRVLDIVGQLTDTVLPVWEYNTCNTVATSLNDWAEMDIEVFPNPMQDETTLRFNNISTQDLNISLMNISGQQLRSWSDLNTSELRISRGNLPAGLYFIRVQDGKGNQITKKVMMD